MQKQITLTELKATYTKDFDTFGKMDPFLVFTVGNCQGKTEIATDAGKEPAWKATIVLTYFDQAAIDVRAYEEDVTQNQYMGQGKIEIKALKASGNIQIKILDKKSQQVGTIFGKYVVKTLPPVPLLIVKNIKCNFYKETKFLLKTKPYFSVTCQGVNIVTAAKEQGNARSLAWAESLKIKIKEGEKIIFNVQDKNDSNAKIFGYETTVKQFKTLAGTKKFNVIDKKFQPLGVMEFDYQTQNFVSKQQSAKNEELAKKESGQLIQITIDKIKGSLTGEQQDLYFKINVGPTMVKTQVAENAKKDFTFDVKKVLYSDRKENSLIISAFDKQMLNDDYLYFGDLAIDGLTSGDKSIKLMDRGKSYGEIIVSLTVKKVPSRQLKINQIQLKMKQSADFIGKSDPFVLVTVGGWSGRTQTGEGNDVAFKNPIQIKYSEEKEILFEVFDEDVTSNELLYTQKHTLQNLKQSGEIKVQLKKQGEKDASKIGELIIKYTGKNVAPPPAPPKKQQPKKTQPKKQQPKKEQPKKQQPKPVPVEVKKQEPKVVPPPPQPKPEPVPPPKQQKPKQPEVVKVDKSLDGSSLQKSRKTIRLPSINDPKNYGDKIFDKQSSSTLQKSILVYSMPKAERFNTGPKYAGEPSYYVDTCFKPNSNKGVGFGYGSKRQFPQWMEKNMKENPAPGAYLDNSGGPNATNSFRAKGPTFGISYKYYEKVTIPKDKIHPKSSQKLRPIHRKEG